MFYVIYVYNVIWEEDGVSHFLPFLLEARLGYLSQAWAYSSSLTIILILNIFKDNSENYKGEGYWFGSGGSNYRFLRQLGLEF